jgi:MYXO-CTERM domain-containing protein
MTSHRLIAAVTIALSLAVSLVAPSAAAFCRSTTCVPKKEKCPIDSDGCVESGHPIIWGKSTLAYRFHEAGSTQLIREEARAAIRAAFNRWSDTVCPDGRRTSLRFVEGEDVTEDKPLEKNVQASEPFAIFFRDLGWPYDDVDETLAKTNTTFDKKNGRILYADMEVNTTRRFSTDEASEEIDLQAVMTHEVGHYIGLNHSKVPQSIMAESYCSLDDRCAKGKVAARRLSPDDIDALCTLYPPDGVEKIAEDSKSPISCAASPAPASGRSPVAEFGLAASFLFGLAAVLRRRRYR